MRKVAITFVLLVILAFLLPAERRQIDFMSADINDSDEIILTVKVPSLSGSSYKTLIRGRADTLNVEALTLYPERSFYFPERNEIMVYNHFRSFIYDINRDSWKEMTFMPSFSSGQPLSPLSLKAVEMSPDGRYAAYIKEDEGNTASLILFDREMNLSLTVSSRLKREYLQKMVEWSPDSKYFIYRRGRDLYYFSIEQYLSDRIPAESFRNTGFKDIQTVQWKSGNYLYIIKDRLLYRIHSSEFFTRSFYSAPFRQGTVRGRIPLTFDPAFDRFTVDDQGKHLFLLKNGLHGMVLPLILDANSSLSRQTPVLNLSLSEEILSSQWLDNAGLLVLVYNKETKISTLFRYQPDKYPYFKTLSSGDFTGMSVSPRGKKFALFTENSIDIYESEDDKPGLTFSQDYARQFYWGKNTFYSLGEQFIRILDPKKESSRIIGLSQSETSGFNGRGDLICSIGDTRFTYKEDYNWITLDTDDKIRSPRNTTKNYRIYLEDLRGNWYSSSLKVRNNETYYSSDFIPAFYPEPLAVPPLQQPLSSKRNPWYFERGRSSGRKEVALVINAPDSAEGTAQLLKTLDNYRIPGTFFINGDFIHSNPMETKAIAESGHTVGSLFYTWFDFSNSDYKIDKTFLKKGLAKNEDDYFIATGHEMAMLWHTPGYFINSDILEVSEAMEYVFIATDIAVQDRISRTNAPAYNAVEEAEKLLVRVQPGSIITLTLGKEEGQKEYLFQTVSMIFDELIRKGYEFVDLQKMMKNSPY